MCVRDIACRMIERNSNVPRIIDRLELKKLVRRTASPNDGRETSIIITQAGLHLLEASTARIDKSFEKLILMEETSAIQLNDLLEKIREKED
ncbi:MAG TPA: MarR family transcriptional regulator, partial [Chitinophagaceae bacterium]|nr:MarR family transcriptional regulator [Chitinophagaceae bacterium]